MNTIQIIIDKIFSTEEAIDPKKLEAENLPAETIEKIVLLQQLQVDYANAEAKLAGHQRKSAVDTFVLIERLKESLIKTLVESSSVQGIIKWMFSLTFLLGFILIGFAIYFGYIGEEFLATAFGGFGMLSIVTLLLKDPPLKMQDSRSNYAQLTIGMLAWLNDLIDKSAMSVQNQVINQKVQNTQGLRLEDIRSVHNECIQNYLNLSNAQIENTVKLLHLIDDVAEPGSKRSINLEEKIMAKKNLTSE